MHLLMVRMTESGNKTVVHCIAFYTKLDSLTAQCRMGWLDCLVKIPCRKIWLMPAARVPCSNAAIIG